MRLVDRRLLQGANLCLGAGLCLVVGLALAGCRARPADGPLVESTPTPLSTPTFTAAEAAFAANLNPLTGLPSEDPDIARRPVLAYAVSAGEPGGMAGVQAMDVVVEVWRSGAHPLTALTRQAPDRRPALGPLASAGGLDVVMSRMFGAQLTAADADAPIRRALEAASISTTLLIDAGTTGDASPDNPTETVTVHGSAWIFDEAAPAAGATVSRLQVADGADDAPTWRYDAVLTVWQRWLADDRADVDGATGEPLAAANLVVLIVPGLSVEAPWPMGTGKAILLRDGRAVDARWRYDDPDRPFALTDTANRPMALRPGNAWVLLVNSAPQLNP